MKQRKKAIISIALVICMLFSMAACGSKDAGSSEAGSGADTERKNTLVYGAEFECDKVNPILGSDYVDEFLFRGLFRMNKDSKPEKDLAKEVTVSDDKLTYTFKVRDDVTFHDGEPLTVDDVIFTLTSIMDKKVNSARNIDFKEVKSIDKVDDNTFKIRLKTQFPPLLDKLTVGIVPEHVFEGKDINEAEFNQNPIGCGPYKFVSWKKGASFEMTAFEDYYGTQPKIKNVIFKFLPDYNTRAVQLESGDVDFTFLEPSQAEKFKKNENTDVYVVDTADYRCINYNFEVTDLFKDVQVRKALNYAIDKEAIVKSIAHGYGEAAYTPLQYNEYATDQLEKYEYDMDKAAKMLKEAGWEKGDDGILQKDGEKFSFTLTAPVTDEVRVNIANYVASEWKKLGVEVKVDSLSWDAIDIFKCEAFVLGFGSPYDADTDTYPMFVSTQNKAPGSNYGSYSNKDVDRALEAARIASDEKDRRKEYTAFQKALAEDPAYNMICYLKAIYGANKRVKGVSTEKLLGHHGAGIFWNIEEWELVE